MILVVFLSLYLYGTINLYEHPSLDHAPLQKTLSLRGLSELHTLTLLHDACAFRLKHSTLRHVFNQYARLSVHHHETFSAHHRYHFLTFFKDIPTISCNAVL